MNRLLFFTRAYTGRGLFQLFMLCAFPIHIWAFLMAFRDLSWVAERTNTWDAVGLLSYAMAFALVETIGVFLIVFVLGLLIPGGWGTEKRLALIGTLFLMLALWAILAQVYSLNGYPLPNWLFDFLVNVDHPLWVMWGGMFLLVTVSVLAPVVLMMRSDKLRHGIIDIFDRISLLSSLYMFFDLVGFVIIGLRNFHG